jgi:hypothetical protein
MFRPYDHLQEEIYTSEINMTDLLISDYWLLLVFKCIYTFTYILMACCSKKYGQLEI